LSAGDLPIRRQPKASALYWSQPTGHAILATLGGDQTYAWGITKNGVIAGYSSFPGDTATHAVIWNTYTNTPTDLGTLPGGANSYARGINDAGQVVGFADVP
jgi:uncharacterized membrane protein